MKTMLCYLCALLFLGCVTTPAGPYVNPAQYKAIIGQWVAVNQDNTILVFKIDRNTNARTLTLTVGNMVGHGVWLYDNNSLMASIPDMKDSAGNPVKNTAVFGEINAAGHLLLNSAGVEIEFQRPKR